MSSLIRLNALNMESFMRLLNGHISFIEIHRHKYYNNNTNRI